jgi:cytochrome c1
MKNLNKQNILGMLIVAIGASLLFITFSGCFTSAKVAAKSGAQLWAENCQRCHNMPSPATFSPEQWETVGMHMQTRAQLTDQERDKIVAFLKQ